MKENKLKTITYCTIILVLFILFLVSFILFSYTLFEQLTTHQSIDLHRYSDFGSFVGGIFGTISLIILIITLRETKQQSLSALRETKNNASDNLFLGNIHLHDSVILQLKTNENQLEILKKKYETTYNELIAKVSANLKAECIEHASYKHAEFFEVLYGILHGRYKYGNEKENFQFFIDNNWRMGHFIKSFISIVELIYEFEIDFNKKESYIRILKSRSSSNELRLIFYFVLLNNDKAEQKRLVILFNHFNFFKELEKTLIKDDDMKMYQKLKPTDSNAQ